MRTQQRNSPPNELTNCQVLTLTSGVWYLATMDFQPW